MLVIVGGEGGYPGGAWILWIPYFGYFEKSSIVDTAIHGYSSIAHTTVLHIQQFSQYCAYAIQYCVFGYLGHDAGLIRGGGEAIS